MLVSPQQFASIRSGLPSPLKSATITFELGWEAANVLGARNVPSPFPRKTRTSSLKLLPSAGRMMSGFPSPFTSVEAIDCSFTPWM